LQLKKIKRTEKKGTESVMDEKFSVLFWTEFQVGELKFQVPHPFFFLCGLLKSILLPFM
jgi:hypothetical protein